MATVYLVSSGEYSDYGVDAIFTTKEKAEEYIKHNSDAATGNSANNGPYYIEKRELDPESTQRIWTDAWTVWLELETGDRKKDYSGRPMTAWCRREEITEGQRAAEAVIEKERVYEYTGSLAGAVYKGTFEKYAQATSYVSEDHAWKLAAEARQKWLRERAVNPSA